MFMLRSYPLESASIWEWKAPLAVVVFGLAAILVQPCAAAGPEGAAVALIGIAGHLVFCVSVAIVAMYLVATVLDVSFGMPHTAVLKLAAITLFAMGSIALAQYLRCPELGLLIAAVGSFSLFSEFFDLDPLDTTWSVIAICVFQFILGMLVQLHTLISNCHILLMKV